MDKIPTVIDDSIKTIVDTKVSEKYVNLVEYYRALSLKIVTTAESTSYKILQHKNLLDNFKDASSNILANDFIEQIFIMLNKNTIDSNSFELMKQIKKLDKNHEYIMDKLYLIINGFYEVVDRKEIKMEKYADSIEEQFNEFYVLNTEQIFHTITSDKISFKD